VTHDPQEEYYFKFLVSVPCFCTLVLDHIQPVPFGEANKKIKKIVIEEYLQNMQSKAFSQVLSKSPVTLKT
jgi:hypothetical protein